MLPIKHKAQIIRTAPQELTLKITRQTACGTCPAAGLCGMKEDKDQIFSIAVPDSGNYRIGDSVMVELNPHLGWLAVLFCYGLPLFLMLFTLFICDCIGKNEIFSGITAIIILIPYFFLLFLGKKYFKKKFTFIVTEK